MGGINVMRIYTAHLLSKTHRAATTERPGSAVRVIFH